MTPADHIAAAFTQLVAEAVAQGDDLARAGVLADLETQLLDMVFEAADKVRDRVLPGAVQVAF